MEETKFRVVYHTNSDYSRCRYPYLNIGGKWLEECGFLRRDEVFISPRSGTGLAIVNTRIHATPTLPVLAMGRLKPVGVSRFGYASLLLRGRWFWDFGFAYRDEVEMTNPIIGVLHIEILRSGREMEVERDRLRQLGTEEWRLFKELLAAHRA